MRHDAESGMVLFALSGRADADNIAPAIWSIGRDGTKVVVYVADKDVLRDLEHAWWVSECANLQFRRIVGSAAKGVAQRLLRLRWNRGLMRRELRKSQTQLAVMEWGEGVAEQDTGLLRRSAQWWSTNFPTQLQLAARDLGVPTAALPHGHSTKTTIIRSHHVQMMMDTNDGKLPFSDRDSHAAYIFASDYHRDAILQNSTMSGHHVQVWGSARFNDDWVKRLYVATDAAPLPSLRADQLRRVLFFIPKWNNLVDKDQTLRLITALGTSTRIQLVVAGHVRGSDSALTDVEFQAVVELPGVVFVPSVVSSPALIKACDVLVDVDSSIAFDAVLLGKPYVRPRYLQDASVRTIWDELGGAHQTDSLDETVALVTGAQLTPATRHTTFDRVVFGGQGNEVLERYRTGLKRLISSGKTTP